MSVAYDLYLADHIANVGKALVWMMDNLKDKNLINENAMYTAFDNVMRHDESKTSSEEYDAYDAYFYGGNRSYKVCEDFDYAWLHHQKLNPHHWQYWVLIEDDGEESIGGYSLKPLLMPLEYVYEMIADWWAFSLKNGTPFEIFRWYNKNHSNQLMHPKTRAVVNDVLYEMYKVLCQQHPSDSSKTSKQYTLYFLQKENPVIQHGDLDDEEDEYKYGVPELKKYPMPDEAHVKSAIRFFNYVDPKYERELAFAILERMKEYDMSFEDFGVGDENRFKKYIPGLLSFRDENRFKKYALYSMSKKKMDSDIGDMSRGYPTRSNDDIYHYGLKGMKWGVRRWQNDDGTFNEAGKERYFKDGTGENYKKLSTKAKELTSRKAFHLDDTVYKMPDKPQDKKDILNSVSDWEKKLYDQLLKDKSSIDFNKMSEADFKSLLEKSGIDTSKMDPKTIADMLNTARTNFPDYSTKSSIRAYETAQAERQAAQATQNAGAAQTQETKESKGSGSSKSTKEEKEKTEKEKKEKEEPKSAEEIEKNLYESIDQMRETRKDSVSILALMNSSSSQFRSTIKSMTGINASHLTDVEIEQMKQKMKERYLKNSDDLEEFVYDGINKYSETHPEATKMSNLLDDDPERFRENIKSATGIDISHLNDDELNTLKKKIKQHFTKSAEDIERTIYEDAEKKNKKVPGSVKESDIVSDDPSKLRKNIENLTGLDTSHMWNEEVVQLGKRIGNHYAIDNLKTNVLDKMKEIVEKYPNAISNTGEFTKVLSEYGKIASEVLTSDEFYDLYDKIAEAFKEVAPKEEKDEVTRKTVIKYKN